MPAHSSTPSSSLRSEDSARNDNIRREVQAGSAEPRELWIEPARFAVYPLDV